nr:MAG TPA: hypothetical protein [Caudoviricetes sp.]
MPSCLLLAVLFWIKARAGIRTHIAKQYSYAKHGVLTGCAELTSVSRPKYGD